jgi:hypothetical protein
MINICYMPVGALQVDGYDCVVLALDVAAAQGGLFPVSQLMSTKHDLTHQGEGPAAWFCTSPGLR